MSYENKSVVVIGGTANSGRAIAREAAERGATVAFTYNSAEDEARALLDELDGDRHRTWQCDVTDADAVDQVVGEIVGKLDAIDALCYTAGVIDRESLVDTDQNTWDGHVAVNLTGAFNVLGSVGPHLQEQGHGAVVALSASDAVQRDLGLSAYNATKSGLNALLKQAARELARDDVRANVLAPGPIRNPETLSSGAREDLVERTPLGRITTPEDIAAASLFLCSDAAAGITGAVIPIDGGMSL